MKESTREWLKERAAFGTGTKAKEIMEYIEELEIKLKKKESSDGMARCLAMSDADAVNNFNYGSGE